MDTEIEKDKDIVERARKNPAAFGRIFELYHQGILRYCIHRVMNVEIARDITSETFFKAQKKLWQFRWTTAPFSSWLYKIATNEIRMYFRRKKYFPEKSMDIDNLSSSELRRELESEIVETQKMLDTNHAMSEITAALRRLPEKYQEVITLRFFGEMKIEEIAATLNLKEGTIKSILSRGMKMLREKIAVQPILSPCIIVVNEQVLSEVE